MASLNELDTKKKLSQEVDYKSANTALDTATEIVKRLAIVFKNGVVEKKKSDENK